MTTENTASPGYILESQSYTDRERLMILHECMRGGRDEALADAERDYGLGKGGRVRMLDVGSGEALYLFELAREKRYPSFEGWGIDRDAEAMETARSFADLAAIDGLHFAAHDANQPFTEIAGLFGADGTQLFDVTMAVFVLMHIRDHAKTMKYMYEATKPGGVIIAMDTPSAAEAWQHPHPSLTAVMEPTMALVRMSAGGVSVADNHKTLLREAGFVDIRTQSKMMPLGGPTPLGKKSLEAVLMGAKNARSAVVDRFKMAKGDEYDEHLRRMWHETTPAMVGAIHVRVTLARKPD